MSYVKYSPEPVDAVLKDLSETGDVSLASERYGIPKHAIYRFRRQRKNSPEINKDKKIRDLNEELRKKNLENRVLRELLKKTYSVIPIDLESQKDS